LMTTIFLFIIKNRSISIILSILVIVISCVSNQILMHVLNISNWSIREVIAIPLQQTVGDIATYDITEEKKKI